MLRTRLTDDEQRERDQQYARNIANNILTGSLPDVDVAPERALTSLRAMIDVLDAERRRAHDVVYAKRCEEARARRAAIRDEQGAMRLDSLAFLATVALALVPVSLVAVFVARLAGAVAGVA